VYLVNRVRPVTVAWHRAHGPDFLAHAIHASLHAAYSVPRELEGVGRKAAIDRMAEVLRQHGSASLRAELESYGDEIATPPKPTTSRQWPIGCARRKGRHKEPH
jgi:hypothetical protein